MAPINKITPVQQLNIYAKKAVNDVIQHKADAENSVNSLLKYANENQLQGPAVLSIFSRFNALRKNKNAYSKDVAKRIENFPDLFEFEVQKNKSLKKEGDKFIDSLTKSYPKTLGLRTAIAYNGSVAFNQKAAKTPLTKKLKVLFDYLTSPME